MGTSYALDRHVGIVMGVRACLGVLFGVGVLAICVWAISGWRPATSRPNTPMTSGQSVREQPSRVPSTADDRRRVSRRGQRNRSLDRLRDSPGRLAYGFAAGTFFVALSAFEFLIARSMRRGERRAFVSGAAIEGVGAVLGLLSFISRPVAGVGVLLSLVIFLYCIARLSGVGPKPA